ncbi:MAG: penicillin-binding transpeptidase domain-containing protein [Thermaerobacter sp.]|nr:penicillin-binding transpeptidase domain-containing protein [Thermaerobacter sp.]
MPPTSKQRRRIFAALLLVLLVCAALLVRTGYVMLVRGPELAHAGRSVRIRQVPVGAPRGQVITADGAVLAASKTTYALYAVPAQVKSPDLAAQALSSVLGIPADRLQGLLSRRVAIVWLQRRMTDQQVSEVRSLGIVGIGLAPQTAQVFPYGALAGATLGFTGIDNQGLEGLERTYDSALRGTSGSIGIEMDARNGPLPEPRVTYKAPVPGNSLVLTLRADVQRIAEEAAATARADTGAKAVQVIVMDTRTSAILGLAIDPSYNPASFGQYSTAQRRNTVVSDVLPPGSTFKAITTASALAAGVVTPQSPFFDPGFVRVDGIPVHCWKAGGHGAIDFGDVVAKSCNVGFVEVGLRLGVQRFYDYLKAFHVIGLTHVDLPGEARAIVPPQRLVKPIDLATMAFGQTLALSPIELISAISAIADGGIWHTPHVMKEIISPAGKVVQQWSDSGTRIVPQAAAQVAVNLLEGVVTRGSGRPAQIPGYKLAGKTGTAQAVINGRYVEGKYISSFVGFGPASSPQVAMLVEIFEPVGPYYGGQIAAPVVGRAMAQVLAALKIAPDVTPPTPIPDLLGQTATQAQQALTSAGMRATLLGQGVRVTSQFPPAGAAVTPGARVLVYLGAGGNVTVPQLTGLTVSQAGLILGRLGLILHVTGDGVIVQQEPQAGATLPRGAAVAVVAKEPPAAHNT